MAKKKQTEQKEITENIVESSMDGVLIGAFNRYAKEVITDRAIPDVRDGLKPVQRRIVYGMYKGGHVFEKPTVKCATLVGDIMGHYHPHGDSSIYSALVNLSQGWKMSSPLIDFQGNNGSVDNDPPAANRYTEARLSKLSEYLVQDIEKDTVRMTPTFDDKSLEPTVLPARFPNLLVNGADGIAIGLSPTSIPPHNLSEVIEATVYRIEHGQCSLDDIMTCIKGPDFPTGGIIDDKDALRSIYETGRGAFPLYCKTEIDRSENQIIVRELPYGVAPSDFVTKLLKRKETDKLDNIDDVIDASAKDYIEIIIQVKRGASADDILNYLQSKNALRVNITCNYLAIDKGHPKTMPLLDILDAYIDHQRDIETKACAYDLREDNKRLEIVSGFIKLVSILDEVIAKIRKCSGKEGVKKMLQNDYGFTEPQSEAIATMPLYRLSNTDIVAYQNEAKKLREDIARLKGLLSDSEKLDNYIINNLRELQKNFSLPRRTQILDEKQSFDAVDQTKLVAKEDCYVAITKDGYVKRSTTKSYVAASKDDEDPLHLPKIKPGDKVVMQQLCSTHDTILFFTDMGNYGTIPVYTLPEAKWKEEGKHINNVITVNSAEKIVKCFKISAFKKGLNVVILTAMNKIKRVPLPDFAPNGLNKKVIRACKMQNKDDRVVGVAITSGNSDILVVDQLGRSSRFNEGDIPLVTVTAMGVKAIASSADNKPLVSLVTFRSDEVSLLFVVSEKRAVRLINSAKIDQTERLGPKSNLIHVFKTDSARFNIVSVSKVQKVRGEKTYVGVTTNDSSTTIDISSLSPIDLNAEMRENVDSLGKKLIVGVHEAGEVIDEKTKVEEPRPAPVATVKASVDKADTQLSLFDLFEKDRNK